MLFRSFGVLKAPHAWLAIPAGILAGASFGAVMLAFAGNVTNEDHFFTFVGRFIIQPMFFLSGTFFPLDSIPLYLRWIGWISPLWHATDLGRWVAYGHSVSGVMLAVHLSYLTALLVGGLWTTFGPFEKRLYK